MRGREEGMGGRREGDSLFRSTRKHGTSNDLVTHLLKMSFQEIYKI